MLAAPPVRSVLFWVALDVACMLGTDYLIGWRGKWDFTAWKAQPFYVSALRVAAVCFAGPVFEELIFRGVLFYKMNRLFAGRPWITVIVLAAVWSAIHYTYSPVVIFIIFVEGVLLGAALLKSRSLYVPIVMHICWNLYAVW